MTAAPVVSLDDKYDIGPGHALIAGRQALVRLPLVQRALDEQAGRRTAGYITGYRGSPLGGYDSELWKAAKLLEDRGIVFDPGLNEDIAVTAAAGSQQIDFVPGGKVEGVFAVWYGKGPGVDRSGDAIKHANLAGTSPSGGVVLVFGDDHAGKSSTTAHQSDVTLASWGVPVLYPASVGEIVPLGLAAIAMSRFSGAVVALKIVNETAESTAVVETSLPPELLVPDMVMPDGGVHIRPEFLAMQKQEFRLLHEKLPRAQAFSRINALDHVAYGSSEPKLLIATAGKAYPDVIEALALLGLDEATCREAGLGVYKIALLYPLDCEPLLSAAASAEEILFVEEKQAHAENQTKQALFHRLRHVAVSGKADPAGSPLLPDTGTLNASIVARALAARIRDVLPDLTSRLRPMADAAEGAAIAGAPLTTRRPEFCAGCPHNSSTKVPDGSIAITGIGCHGMAVFHPERNPLPMAQMGGEGASWIGLSHFTETRHVFQNLGDGTYNHSGSLAIRAAVQARSNMTFKILFNDAVAMTGGQPVEGQLTVSAIVRQVLAEGVRRVVVLSEEPGRFSDEPLPPGTDLRHRDELSAVQTMLRQQAGVSVLIYDQVCAAEKRRRRKAGSFPDPDRRVFINSLVCEGCGDCSVQSNCMAIEPLETELGLKRRINQSACNKDFSCEKGFCPSFVTLEGAKDRTSAGSVSGTEEEPAEPRVPVVPDAFDIMIAGVGGTGVVTIGAILGMAARIDGLTVNLFDMTGLSQKGGAVFSHIRLGRDAAAAMAAKIGPRQARTVIACDMVASVQPECLETISGQTLVVVNGDVAPTALFHKDRDAVPSAARLGEVLASVAGLPPHVLSANDLAEKMFGDAIAANMIMLGLAWQLGGIPLSRSAIEQAVRLNGKAVAANLRAFAAGRRAAITRETFSDDPPDLATFIAARTADLSRYWNDAYARRYADLLSAARKAAQPHADGEALVWAIARSAYKLMAYKDEYEVARLYSDGRFRAALAQEYGSIAAIKVHLSPPLFARRDPQTGRPRKYAFGSWVFLLFRVLSSLRRLREGPFDIFARSHERRMERRMRDLFMTEIARRLEALPDNFADTLALARAALDVRGFGPVRKPAMDALIGRLTAHSSDGSASGDPSAPAQANLVTAEP